MSIVDRRGDRARIVGLAARSAIIVSDRGLRWGLVENWFGASAHNDERQGGAIELNADQSCPWRQRSWAEPGAYRVEVNFRRSATFALQQTTLQVFSESDLTQCTEAGFMSGADGPSGHQTARDNLAYWTNGGGPLPVPHKFRTSIWLEIMLGFGAWYGKLTK